MDHPRPGLRYVDAKDLDKTAMKFDGLNVSGTDGEKLGEVEGFVMDVLQGRPRHVAVGAGWFIHKHFLLPIGHVAMSADGTKLIADLTKDRVERFPGFDKDEFEKLSDEEMTRLDAAVTAACVGYTAVADSATHHQVPEWWEPSFYQIPTGNRPT